MATQDFDGVRQRMQTAGNAMANGGAVTLKIEDMGQFAGH